jgi:hypothetical protein
MNLKKKPKKILIGLMKVSPQPFPRSFDHAKAREKKRRTGVHSCLDYLSSIKKKITSIDVNKAS